MALTTETRTINGTDFDFYVTENDSGTLYGINQGGLATIDVTALQDVDANGTGANLKEKLKGYTLTTNGQDGFETYGPNIVNIDTFENLVRAYAVTNSDVVGKQTIQGGTTANRPSDPDLYEGYFDTTVDQPIWWDGTNWVDSTGTAV